jgi:hypothetical protein
MQRDVGGYPSVEGMSSDPKTASDGDEDDHPRPLPEGEDPLTARLRKLRWPRADDETRERALDNFRKLIAEREEPEPESAGD